jgi:CRP-like cAMP-binding protein/anti-anti-sigma regulatory factor
VRACYSGSQINSRKSRSSEETEIIQQSGDLISVYQLQGNLDFVTTEVLVSEVTTCSETVKYLILDLRRVLTINQSSCLLLHQLLLTLKELDISILFTHAARFPLLRRIMRVKLTDQFDQAFRSFEGNDEATEWCEEQLLDEALPDRSTDRIAALSEYELFEGLTEDEMKVIEKLLQPRAYSKGEIVVDSGDSADFLYIVSQGSASVILASPNGSRKRLASFSAGMAFGEMAIMDGRPRSATVIADTELKCHLLDVSDLKGLTETSPAILIKLLENISLSLSDKLRRTNRELSIFE